MFGQYKKKKLSVKIREIFITILFLRPAVDAYRISTNHNDREATFDPLVELMVNKATELGSESIPGAVLQMYVILTDRANAGTHALLSIAISIMTTGYTSAMISE